MNEKQIVYVWGFHEDELRTWPADFQSLVALPDGAPLLLHVRAVEEYNSTFADESTGSREIVLYLPRGATIHPESDFAALVNEED